MKLSVVIGANYGDEGKGRTVDYLSDPQTLVVRFNGGAQAGHTVATVGDHRHVFHHFGSGTFKGAGTFLTRYFVVNPILFSQEHPELQRYRPQIFVDPRCRITTPWDMMLNQAVENKRAGKRHGSCGLGVNETVTREEHGFGLLFKNLENTNVLMAKLDRIINEWVPQRMKELQIDVNDLPHVDEWKVRERFIEDCTYVFDNCWHWDWPNRWGCFNHLVFEGAQGLRLDELGEDFPYVTRSRTGLTNVMALLREAGLWENLEVYYVTRPYLTRHGAGPLANELAGPPYPTIVDPTNVPHPYQGTIRYAWLDLDVLARNIAKDLGKTQARGHLVLTCLDQVPPEFVVVVAGKPCGVTEKDVARFVSERAGLGQYLMFNGLKAPPILEKEAA
jgi:adenylosuccinate synthase